MRGPSTALMVVCVAALLPTLAHAEYSDPNRGTANVGPVTTGPVVSTGSAGYDGSGTSASVSSQAPSAPGPGPAASNSNGYTYRPVPYNYIPGTGAPQNTGGGVVVPGGGGQQACPPGETGYYVYDATGAPLGVYCYSNAPQPTPPPLPITVVVGDASGHQPWPKLTVDVNPGRGLTGLESWYWLGGDSPNMPDVVVSDGDLSVRVRATLTSVAWDFGDGGGARSADIGQAYPAHSDVAHVYQTDSAGLAGGYAVTAAVRYEVSYSVDDGAFVDFGAKSQSYTTHYVVDQIQPQAEVSR